MWALLHHYSKTSAHSFITELNFYSFPSLCVPAPGDLKVCTEVGGDRQSAAESLEGAGGSDRPTAAAAYALHSPRKHGTKRTVQLDGISIERKCI